MSINSIVFPVTLVDHVPYMHVNRYRKKNQQKLTKMETLDRVLSRKDGMSL